MCLLCAVASMSTVCFEFECWSLGNVAKVQTHAHNTPQYNSHSPPLCAQSGVSYRKLLQLLALYALGLDYLKLGDRARRLNKLEHMERCLAKSHMYSGLAHVIGDTHSQTDSVFGAASSDDGGSHATGAGRARSASVSTSVGGGPSPLLLQSLATATTNQYARSHPHQQHASNAAAAAASTAAATRGHSRSDAVIDTGAGVDAAGGVPSEI